MARFSLGSTALLVLVAKAQLDAVYWAQALVSLAEAIVVWALVQRSDWRRHAREAALRQGKPDGTPLPMATRSPPQSPAATA